MAKNSDACHKLLDSVFKGGTHLPTRNEVLELQDFITTNSDQTAISSNDVFKGNRTFYSLPESCDHQRFIQECRSAASNIKKADTIYDCFYWLFILSEDGAFRNARTETYQCIMNNHTIQVSYKRLGETVQSEVLFRDTKAGVGYVLSQLFDVEGRGEVNVSLIPLK